jgi:hypothetical protein
MQSTPDPDSHKNRPALRTARVEWLPLAGRPGDELEARQNAAIKEILHWLQQRHSKAHPA